MHTQPLPAPRPSLLASGTLPLSPAPPAPRPSLLAPVFLSPAPQPSSRSPDPLLLLHLPPLLPLLLLFPAPPAPPPSSSRSPAPLLRPPPPARPRFSSSSLLLPLLLPLLPLLPLLLRPASPRLRQAVVSPQSQQPPLWLRYCTQSCASWPPARKQATQMAAEGVSWQVRHLGRAGLGLNFERSKF